MTTIDKTYTISIGDNAPNFRLANTENDFTILKGLAGQPILLIFYASDKLPECRELILNLGNIASILDKFNVKVVTISADPFAITKNFGENTQLPFIFLADPEYKVSSL
jgi:peroxiredoxin Q/BCP